MSSWKGQAEEEKIQLREAEKRRDAEEYQRQQEVQRKKQQEADQKAATERRQREEAWQRENEERQRRRAANERQLWEEENRRAEERRKKEEEKYFKDLAERFLTYHNANQKGELISLLMSGKINSSQFQNDKEFISSEKFISELRQKNDRTLSIYAEEIKQSLKLVTEIISWYFNLRAPYAAKELVLTKDITSQVIDSINYFLNLPECNSSRTFKTLTIEEGGEITANQLVGLMRHVEVIQIKCNQLSDELIRKISDAKQETGVDWCVKKFVLKSGIQASTVQVKQLFHLLSPVRMDVQRLSNDKGYSWGSAVAYFQGTRSSFKFSGPNAVTSEEVNEILSFTQTTENSLCIEDGGFTPELSLSSPEKITEFTISGRRFYTSIGDGKFEKLLTDCYRIGMLAFQNIVFQTAEAKTAFLKAIIKKTDLTILKLDNCQLNDNDLDQCIIPYLRTNPNLSCLSLRDNQLTLAGISRLAEYIRDFNLQILTIDVYPHSLNNVPLLTKILERNQRKSELEKEVTVVADVIDRYKNFDEIFTVEALQRATSNLYSAFAKSETLMANNYPNPNRAKDTYRQVMDRKKALFFAWLNAIVMQPDAKGKLLCHSRAIEVLRSLDFPVAELTELYSEYETKYLPEIPSLVTNKELTSDIERLFDAIKKFLTQQRDEKMTARRSQLFLTWLNAIERQVDPQTKLSCHGKAIEFLSQLDLHSVELDPLYTEYETRCLSGISGPAVPLPESQRLFSKIKTFLVNKLADNAEHFVAIARVYINDSALEELCKAARLCRCEYVMKDLVKIYIDSLKPNFIQFNWAFSRFPMQEEEINYLWTYYAYSLHANGRNATEIFANCADAVRVAKSKALNAVCLLDCYVAYAVALKNVLDLQNLDVKFLDLEIWKNLHDFLLSPPVSHNAYSRNQTCRALLKFCQVYLEKNLKRDSKLEKDFIDFLCYCVANLPRSESENIEACLVRIYKAKILNLIGVNQSDAEIFLENNLKKSERLADVVSQLNTYFIKRGSIDVYLAKWKESSVASRVTVLQEELESLVTLFKVAPAGPIARLNLAGDLAGVSAANIPPSYADPMSAAVSVQVSAPVQVSPPLSADNDPSSAIDGGGAQSLPISAAAAKSSEGIQPIPVPAVAVSSTPKLTPKPNPPDAAAVGKSMAPVLKKPQPKHWPVVPSGDEVDQMSNPVPENVIAVVTKPGVIKVAAKAAPAP